MAYVERRILKQHDRNGRIRSVVRYKVRYRDPSGGQHSETRARLVDAERRKAEIEVELTSGRWLDPKRGELVLSIWAAEWIKTRHDLRATTRARLDTTLRRQVLPKFGSTPLSKISNPAVRSWVAELLETGLSAASVRKAVFALRQCLAAAVDDRRIGTNPALAIALPAERLKVPTFLSQREVERLVDEIPQRYVSLVLVGAYAGLRWGEAINLRRSDVDVVRSRIRVVTTAVELHGKVTFGHEPKTARSKRTVPVARSVMRRIESHLETYVDPDFDALLSRVPPVGHCFALLADGSWHRPRSVPASET